MSFQYVGIKFIRLICRLAQFRLTQPYFCLFGAADDKILLFFSMAVKPRKAVSALYLASEKDVTSSTLFQWRTNIKPLQSREDLIFHIGS